MRNDLGEEVKLADRWTLAVWPLQPVAQSHLAAVPLVRDFWELPGAGGGGGVKVSCDPPLQESNPKVSLGNK